MRGSAADAAPVICAQVTTEEDLEIIFSRFGKITSCDIIRDYKTGALLALAPSSFRYKNDVNKHMLLVNAASCRCHARFGANAAWARCNHLSVQNRFAAKLNSLTPDTAGDSLCYAFIGFDNDKSSEEAYFKMNNVLIDDRRIKARPHCQT